MFFKKRESEDTTELFGRTLVGDEIYKPKHCDVCGKEVRFSDCAYLCKECYEKLPKYVYETHHWLIPFKEARKEYLTKAIRKKRRVTFLESEKRVEYIKLHFSYMEFYQATRKMLIEEGYLKDD